MNGEFNKLTSYGTFRPVLTINKGGAYKKVPLPIQASEYLNIYGADHHVDEVSPTNASRLG